MGDEKIDIALAKVLTDLSNVALLNIDDLCFFDTNKIGEDTYKAIASRCPLGSRQIIISCKDADGAVQVMKHLVEMLKIRTQLSLEVVNEAIEDDEDKESDKGYHVTQSVKLEIRKEFYDKLSKFQAIEEILNGEEGK